MSYYNPLGPDYLRVCEKCGTKWWNRKKRTICYQCEKGAKK
jgi:hypothetical protein